MLFAQSDDASNSGGKEFEVEVGVSFVAVFAGQNLALLGDADGAGEGAFGKGAEEPAGGAGAAADGAASAMKKLGDHAFFAAGGGHRFLAFEDAPLGSEDSGVFIGVRVAHHRWLHSGGMRSHDREVFAQDDVGVGKVFACFKEGADGQSGAPKAIGVPLGKSGFTGKNLDKENIRDRAGHADNELAEAAGTALAEVGGEESEVSENMVCFFPGFLVAGKEGAGVFEFGNEKFTPLVLAPGTEICAIRNADGGEKFRSRLIVSFGVVANVE